MAPGDSLRTEVELVDVKDGLIRAKGSGTVSSGAVAVQGKLELKACNVADVCPAAVGADARIVRQLKEQFRIIGGPEALAAAGGQAV